MGVARAPRGGRDRDVEPACGGNPGLIADDEQDAGRRRFDKRRSPHLLSGLQGLEVVDGDEARAIEMHPPAPRRSGPCARVTPRLAWRGIEPPDCAHACVDDDRRAVGEAVGEQRLMPACEARCYLSRQISRMPRHAVERHVDLVDLLPVAHVGRAAQLDRAAMPGRHARLRLALERRRLADMAARCVRPRGRAHWSRVVRHRAAARCRSRCRPCRRR